MQDACGFVDAKKWETSEDNTTFTGGAMRKLDTGTELPALKIGEPYSLTVNAKMSIGEDQEWESEQVVLEMTLVEEAKGTALLLTSCLTLLAAFTF